MIPKKAVRPVLFSLLLVGSTPLSKACIWDSDTLAAERARFPGLDMLIAGHFPRHSQEFHEWRIQQREKDILSDQSLPLHFDDLAVSQHKRGDHKAAIATMVKKDRLVPGLYETYSNLGTFYIYTGDYKQALVNIRKALAINANAHFGREKYQKWLVEWMLEKSEPSAKPETLTDYTLGYQGSTGFAHVVVQRETGITPPPGRSTVSPNAKQRAAAIQGVTGMMMFADYDNPLLLEALGDLLISGEIQDNASHLATLAFMHASLKVVDPAEKARLLEKCRLSGQFTKGFKLEDTEKRVQSALAKSAAYQELVRRDEMKWIKEGADVAVEYQKKYLPLAGDR